MLRRLSAIAVALALAPAGWPLVAQDAALARARALLEKTALIDGHHDLPCSPS